MDESAVDEKVLQDFMDSMGEEGLPGAVLLINTYLENSAPIIQQMIQHLHQENLEELRQKAHTLKSSSAIIGAVHLSNLCRQVEDKSARGSLSRLQEDIAAIQKEYQRTRQQLTQWLQTNAE